MAYNELVTPEAIDPEELIEIADEDLELVSGGAGMMIDGNGHTGG